MVWRSLNLVLSLIMDWHGRWQKEGVTKKFTCTPLPFLSFLTLVIDVIRCFCISWLQTSVLTHFCMCWQIGWQKRNQAGVVIHICLLVLRMLSLPPWFKVELMYCNIIYLDFLFFLYLVNFTISFVILDLWKLWHLSFLVRLGVVCGTWFRYILFSLLHMMAMVT